MMECPTSSTLMDAFAATCDTLHYEGEFARGHLAADLLYGEFEGKIHPKGLTFLFMVLVKHMWIAYCGAVHGRGEYTAREVWCNTIRRVRERVQAYLLTSGRFLTRLEEWVTREEGPQAMAIAGEKARREQIIKPLGTVDWEAKPSVLDPATPWETLLNLVH